MIGVDIMSKIVKFTESAVKFFNIVIHRGVRAYTGYGEIVDGFKEISQAIGVMQNESRNRKIHDFIMGVRECNEELNINDEDFLHIIRQLAKDDEVSKTEFYSKLTISLSNSTMDRDERAFYINTLGALTRYEVEFARKLLIYSTFDLRGYKNKKEQMSSLTSGNDGILLKTLNKLISCGLVFDTRPSGLSGAMGVNYRKTEQLDKFISYIHQSGSINPIAISEKEKDKVDLMVITHKLFENGINDVFLTEMEELSINAIIGSRYTPEDTDLVVKYYIYGKDDRNGNDTSFFLCNGYTEYELRKGREVGKFKTNDLIDVDFDTIDINFEEFIKNIGKNIAAFNLVNTDD